MLKMYLEVGNKCKFKWLTRPRFDKTLNFGELTMHIVRAVLEYSR
jgi:hypothetical protein